MLLLAPLVALLRARFRSHLCSRDVDFFVIVSFVSNFIAVGLYETRMRIGIGIGIKL